MLRTAEAEKSVLPPPRDLRRVRYNRACEGEGTRRARGVENKDYGTDAAERPNGWCAGLPELIFQQLPESTVTIKAVNPPWSSIIDGASNPLTEDGRCRMSRRQRRVLSVSFEKYGSDLMLALLAVGQVAIKAAKFVHSSSRGEPGIIRDSDGARQMVGGMMTGPSNIWKGR